MDDHKLVMARAKALMKQGEHLDALVLLERLALVNPNAVTVQWYRSKCLLRLGRNAKAKSALDLVLRARPNFVPAILHRVKLARDDDEENFDAESLLRRVLAIEPDRARAMYWLADTLLKQGGQALSEEQHREVLNLLNASIELHPDMLRARLRRADYLVSKNETSDVLGEVVVGTSGRRYLRGNLKLALEDYQFVAKTREYDRAEIRAANLLIMLGSPEGAIEHFDNVLARLAPVDARRAAIEEMKHRASNAAVKKSLIASDQPSSAKRPVKEPEKNLATAAVHELEHEADNEHEKSGLGERSSWFGVLGGNSIFGFSPPQLKSKNSASVRAQQASLVAQQIFDQAHEDPDVKFEPVSHVVYAPYQRRHIEASTRDLEPLGYAMLADVESIRQTRVLGTQVLMRLFLHPKLGVLVAYAIKTDSSQNGVRSMMAPLGGSMRTQHFVECYTQLDNGVFVGTRATPPSTFDNASPNIRLEELLPDTPIADLVKRHGEKVMSALKGFRMANIVVPSSLEAIQMQWTQLNRLKSEQRRARGYVSDKELRKLLGKQYDSLHGKVHERLNQLVKETTAHEQAGKEDGLSLSLC